MEWRGREWRGGKGRAGQGRVPDCLGGLSRVGISSRSTRPWNGQTPSNNNVRPNSAHHVERYFLISLHCFNIRKTSMNAAGRSRCCVSTTVQLVMYHH